MSGNLRERSCATGKSGSGGGNDEDAGDVLATKDDSDDRTKKARGRKVKRVSFFWFRKFNNRKNQLGCFGGGGGGGGGRRGGRCNLCMKKPVTLESPVSSPTSDPNSSEFSYDMLRSLIENNDFYDQDCNTHFVIDFEEYRRLQSSSHLKAK